MICPLAVQGHLVPVLLTGHRTQAHVSQAGQGGSAKSSDSVDAQRVDRFLIQNLEIKNVTDLSQVRNVVKTKSILLYFKSHSYANIG